MYKIDSIDQEGQDFLKKFEIHDGKVNPFNNIAPNWKEISGKEFETKLYGCYMPKYIDYRQILLESPIDRKKYLTPTYLYVWEDGTGVAIARHYGYNKKGDAEYASKYYSFCLCEHDYKGLSIEECTKLGIYHAGRCYHVSKCEKCGHVYAVDSSD